MPTPHTSKATVYTQYNVLDTYDYQPSEPLPNVDWICTIFMTIIKGTKYFIEVGVLNVPRTCIDCSVDNGKDTPFTWNDCQKMTTLRCTVSGIETKIHYYSLYAHSIFFQSKCNINIVMNIEYFWLVGWKTKISHTTIQTLIGTLSVSTNNISKYVQLFTEICAYIYFNMNMKIGGPYYIVQIYETLLLKRKSGKGRKLDR